MKMETTFVGDAADFIRGVTFKPHQRVEPSDADAIVCMRTKNVQRDLDESDLIAVPRSIIRNKSKFLQEGDILISSANSWELVGKCSYVHQLDYPATAGGFIGIVRPRKGKTHPRFFYHWLNSPRTQHDIRNLGRQTTNISNLDVNRFKELELPRLDYSEQSRIADILDKADGIRRKREKALSLADVLIRSAFLELFGDPVSNPKDWPVYDLGECVDEVRYGTSVKCTDDQSAGLPVLRIPNVSGGEILWNDLKFATLPEKETDKLLMKKGDLVFVRTNGNPDYIARCAVFDSEKAAIYASYLIRARFAKESKLTPYYTWMALSLPSYRQVLLKETRTTAGNYNISGSGLKSLKIPAPPLEMQAKFQSFYGRLQGAVSKMRSDLIGEISLFNSLSKRAFSGEL